MVIGLSGADAFMLINTTTNETKMCLMVIAALYFLLQSIDVSSESKQKRYTVMAGLIAGLGIGFKLTAGCYALALLVALFFERYWNNRRLFVCVIFSVWVMIGFLLANGYWMFLLYKHFQNPLFPYYNNIFHSSYAPYISFNISPTFEKLTLQHYLFLPFYLITKNRFTSEIYLADMRFAVIFVLGVLLGLKVLYTKMISSSATHLKNQDQRTKWQLFCIFFFASYVIWLYMFAVYRYAIPLEILSGFIIVYFITRLSQSTYVRFLLLTLLSFLLILTTDYPNWDNHHSYGKKFFDVTPPPIASNSTIVLTNVTLSYVIPFFHKNARFIGLPFIQLGVDKVTRSEIEDKQFLIKVMHDLHSRKAPLYSLSLSPNDRVDKKTFAILNYFGFIKKQCKLFTTNVDQSLELCELMQFNGRNRYK
jgi:hypothetical protein